MPPRFRDLISSPTFWKFSNKKRKFKMTSSSRMCKSRDWKRDEEYRFRHGGGGGRGYTIIPPTQNFQKHANKNASKSQKGLTAPRPLCPKTIDPPTNGFWKKFSLPPPWIFFQPYASIIKRDNERKIEDASLCLYCNPSLTRRFFFLNPKLPIQDKTSFGVYLWYWSKSNLA